MSSHKSRMRLAKDIGMWILSLTLVFGFIFNLSYQGYTHHLEHQKKVAQYKQLVLEYDQLASACEDLDHLGVIDFNNNPRSVERVKSVLEYFSKITSAKCFVNSRGTVYKNRFRNVELEKSITSPPGTVDYEIFQAILYEVDEGIPFLRTGGSICGDGTFSPSVGRGTCSWHRGYAGRRGKQLDLVLLTEIYDPRVRLKQLTG